MNLPSNTSDGISPQTLLQDATVEDGRLKKSEKFRAFHK
jgi:hypothetical protein